MHPVDHCRSVDAVDCRCCRPLSIAVDHCRCCRCCRLSMLSTAVDRCPVDCPVQSPAVFQCFGPRFAFPCFSLAETSCFAIHLAWWAAFRVSCVSHIDKSVFRVSCACLRRACAEQAGLADYKRPIPLLMDKAEKSEKTNCSNGPQDTKSLEKTIQAQMVIFLADQTMSAQSLHGAGRPGRL